VEIARKVEKTLERKKIKMAHNTVFLFLAGVDAETSTPMPSYTWRVKAPAEFPDEPVSVDCLISHLNAIKTNVNDVSVWATLLRTHDLDPLAFVFYKRLPICPDNILSSDASLASYDREPKDRPLYFLLPDRLGITFNSLINRV
jgi:hypothetical protein